MRLPLGMALAVVVNLAFSPAVALPAPQNFPNVAQVQDSLRSRYHLIKDYTVELTASLNMPNLRIPRKRMTLSYKRPDKFRLESRGLAVLPRQALLASPDSLLSGLRGARISGEREIDGHRCLIINGEIATPGDEDLQVKVVTEVAVDRQYWVIREVATFVEDTLTIHIANSYTEVATSLYLPSETRLKFRFTSQLPFGGAESHMGRRQRRRHTDPDMPGTAPFEEMSGRTGEATITYSKYRVNRGLEDSYFERRDKRRKKPRDD